MNWRARNPMRRRPDPTLPEAVERACDRLIAAVDQGEAACAVAWADLVDAHADHPGTPAPPWDAAYAMLESRLGEGAADRVKAEAWRILRARGETTWGKVRAVVRRLMAAAALALVACQPPAQVAERHVIDCANPDFRQVGCVHPRVLRFAPVRERAVSSLPRIV